MVQYEFVGTTKYQQTMHIPHSQSGTLICIYVGWKTFLETGFVSSVFIYRYHWITVQKNWLLSIPTWDYFVITDYHLVFSSAPAIFERCMENLLQCMNGVCVYFDDILVTSSSSEGHLQNLDKVLTKIDEAGLRRNRSKCSL